MKRLLYKYDDAIVYIAFGAVWLSLFVSWVSTSVIILAAGSVILFLLWLSSLLFGTVIVLLLTVLALSILDIRRFSRHTAKMAGPGR